jgi:hypothetical protein
MKKLAAFIITASLICSAVFSKGFFDGRIFEYKINVPVNVSNNVFALNDIMKETVVIDLREIANSIPNEGLVLTMGTAPSVGFNLNIAAVSVGLNAGVDVFGKFSLSRGLFDFLGKGMTVGQELDITLSPTLDVFAFSELNVGIKFSRFNIYVRPGAFIPFVSTAGSSGGIKIVNNEDGSLKVTTASNVDVYSVVDISQAMGEDGTITVEDIQNALTNSFGFDLSLGMALPISRSLVVSADARIPVVPAKMNYRTSMVLESETTISADTITNFNFDMPNPEFTPGVTANYKVNRPMKLIGYVDFFPIGNGIDLRAGAGLGVYHPFMESAKVYPQYYAGLTLNFINFLKLTLSTEYTDQVFVHQLGGVINIRLVEIDAGVSLQSTNFAKSWLVAGAGAYVVVCVGF